MFCQLMMAFTLCKPMLHNLKTHKLVFNYFGRKPDYYIYFNPII